MNGNGGFGVFPVIYGGLIDSFNPSSLAVLIVFILLDIINEFKDLTEQFGLIALSILHNLAVPQISIPLK